MVARTLLIAVALAVALCFAGRAEAIDTINLSSTHFQSCSASTIHNSAFLCDYAFDDNVNTQWATAQQGVGSWIRIHFDQPVNVHSLRYKQRDCLCEHNRRVRLSFSDGQSLTVDLAQTTDFQTLKFAAHWTTYVLLTVETVWATTNNGAFEIQYLGWTTDSPPASMIPSRFQSCSASTEHNSAYLCANAFDNNAGTQWATLNQGAGSWISVQLTEPVMVNKFVYQQRGCTCEHNKQILLTFDDTTYTLELAQTTAVQEFTFKDMIVTSSMRMDVQTVWSTTNNGAFLIDLYGFPLEVPSVPAWTDVGFVDNEAVSTSGQTNPFVAVGAFSRNCDPSCASLSNLEVDDEALEYRIVDGGAWTNWENGNYHSGSFRGFAGPFFTTGTIVQLRARMHTPVGWGPYLTSENFTVAADPLTIGDFNVGYGQAGSCVASTEHDTTNPSIWSCKYVSDGIFTDGNLKGWATQNQGVSSYIDISWGHTYWVHTIRLQQRNHFGEHNRQLQVVFTDGSQEVVEMQNNLDVQEFSFAGRFSQGVKITVLTVWGTINNGFTDVQLIGTILPVPTVVDLSLGGNNEATVTTHALSSYSNVAAGKSCDASSHNSVSYFCGGAFDGVIVNSGSTAWATNEECEGSYIYVDIDSTDRGYFLSHYVYHQRPGNDVDGIATAIVATEEYPAQATSATVSFDRNVQNGTFVSASRVKRVQFTVATPTLPDCGPGGSPGAMEIQIYGRRAEDVWRSFEVRATRSGESTPEATASFAATSATVQLTGGFAYDVELRAYHDELNMWSEWTSPQSIGVPDVTPPSVSLNGQSPITIEAGSVWNDPSVSATDEGSGVASTTSTNTHIESGGSNLLVSGSVIRKVGTYLITYTVTDVAGNSDSSVQRTVVVRDTTAPILTVQGPTSLTIEAGDAYIDSGVTVSENSDEEVSPILSASPDFVSNIVRLYRYTYDATDSAGNAAVSVYRNITVVDTTPPLIVLQGDEVVTIEASTTSPYEDAGTTPFDNAFGVLNVQVTGSVDRTTVGVYTLTFSLVDEAGNAAENVSRTVEVEDTTAPILQLLGDSHISISQFTEYTDAGASVEDNTAAASTIESTGNVDTETPGDYVITFSSTDGSGNVADTVQRTVTVTDVDECVNEGRPHNCDENADCTNNIGSFSCRCHTMYEGDGVTCDVPAMQIGTLFKSGVILGPYARCETESIGRLRYVDDQLQICSTDLLWHSLVTDTQHNAVLDRLNAIESFLNSTVGGFPA